MFGYTNKDTHLNIMSEFKKLTHFFNLNHHHYENSLSYTKELYPLYA